MSTLIIWEATVAQHFPELAEPIVSKFSGELGDQPNWVHPPDALKAIGDGIWATLEGIVEDHSAGDYFDIELKVRYPSDTS